MSIAAVAFAFAQQLSATEKWLLVCLADYADEWGDSIFPSLEELTSRSGLSRATLQRTFRALLKGGVIVRAADSTPFSPAFYRIVGMPEPELGATPKRERDCPNALRAAVKYAFGTSCEYCGETGTDERGPDGKHWTVDRVVPGRSGGRYVPENVTLACRRCNNKKGLSAAAAGTRTLADLRARGGPQIDTPTRHRNETRGASVRHLRGLTMRPELLIDPLSEPSEEKAGAAPRPTPDEDPEQNVGVITKLAHDLFELGVRADEFTEAMKGRCAQLHIAYNSSVVRKAIESAQWQRTRRQGTA